MLPVDSTLRLCRDFNNPDNFKQILRPLLVPRIVDTASHRQVGEYIYNFFTQLGWVAEWDQFEVIHSITVSKRLSSSNPLPSAFDFS
ncbi:hypothetical protein GCK32_006584 [Trichostrongylus colubriformis]|uniref:Uncharacterized protein n=1 Tax=Trichostrongylus colubriformis TaxID=6319 RepID=A0AAN8G7V2_TRICO